MKIEIAGNSLKARFMSWKCNSPSKIMPQVCDLNHSFLTVSEYHIFKDNTSKFPGDIHSNGSKYLLHWGKHKVIFLAQENQLCHHIAINWSTTDPPFFILKHNGSAQNSSRIIFAYLVHFKVKHHYLNDNWNTFFSKDSINNTYTN